MNGYKSSLFSKHITESFRVVSIVVGFCGCFLLARVRRLALRAAAKERPRKCPASQLALDLIEKQEILKLIIPKKTTLQ